MKRARSTERALSQLSDALVTDWLDPSRRVFGVAADAPPGVQFAEAVPDSQVVNKRPLGRASPVAERAVPRHYPEISSTLTLTQSQDANNSMT